MIRALDAADARVAYFDFIGRIIGESGLEHLRQHLIERLSFREVADREGRPTGQWGARYVSQRFKGHLDAIVRAQEARGPSSPNNDNRPARRAA